MRIYFSGIGGVGIGPLAEIAQDAGYDVLGSDLTASRHTKKLEKRDIPIGIGQDGSYLKQAHEEKPVDWFVYTAALPDDHAELQFATKVGIRTSKRDELLAHIISEKNLRLLAVAGTHGKTTASGMIVWLFNNLGIPISYSVGANMSFGPSGAFNSKSQYFIYECDEYDRNFLHFNPWATIITSVDYDHPNIFPTVEDYQKAFLQFLSQSGHIYLWQKDAAYLSKKEPLVDRLLKIDATPHRIVEVPDDTDIDSVHLAGEHTRRNGYLVSLLVADGYDAQDEATRQRIFNILSNFPGTERRFEKLADGLYSDYGHHPVEIAATLQMAQELNERIVLVYQPHQNVRQHHIKNDYADSMKLAEQIYWLPTYLSREDPELPILTPNELINILENKEDAAAAEMDDGLWEHIEEARRSGALVLVMGAGSIDTWIRQRVAVSNIASTE